MSKKVRWAGAGLLVLALGACAGVERDAAGASDSTGSAPVATGGASDTAGSAPVTTGSLPVATESAPVATGGASVTAGSASVAAGSSLSTGTEDSSVWSGTAASSGILPGTPEETGQYFGEHVGDRVFFAFDSHDLDEEARLVLARQAAWLELYDSARILIEGHCDERGTREYNLALGSRRATAVRDYLVSFGISNDRIEYTSYGKEQPVALCAAESCWSQNRRAVSVLRGSRGS